MTASDLRNAAVGLVAQGLGAVLPERARGRLGILCYHRVVPRVPGVAKPSINVTPRRFRAQLTGLLERGYAFWPLRRVLEYRAAEKPLPPRTLVVTFDDAFESVYLNAWPVLRDLRLPAAVFLSTAFLDARDPFPFDGWGIDHRQRVPPECYRPLTTDQCRAMAREGLVEFGAHTHTHQDFRGRAQDFRSDLQISVNAVQALFGARDVLFAYPYGKPALGFVDERLAQAARQTGVACGLTTEDALVDVGSDPFHWGRFNVYDSDTVGTLRGKLRGWYTWASQVRHWSAGRTGRAKRAARSENAAAASGRRHVTGLTETTATRPTRQPQ